MVVDRSKGIPEATITLSTDSMGCVRVARRFVAEQVDSHTSEHTTQAMQLAVSELVTNAIEHGLGGTLTVGVGVGPEAAHIRVTSESAPDKPIPAADRWAIHADPTQPSGRGLGIVRAVSDAVALERAGRTVTVTATFHLDHAPAARRHR